ERRASRRFARGQANMLVDARKFAGMIFSHCGCQEYVDMDKRTIYTWKQGELKTKTVSLPPEEQFCIQVNGQEIVRLMASPNQRQALVVGFLTYTGLLQDPAEISALYFAAHNTCVDVWLDHAIDVSSAAPLLTSGCGMGTVLGQLYHPPAPLQYDLSVRPDALFEMLVTLQANASLYHESRGMHASALFTPAGELLALAEDIGRHNTLDKLLGLALLTGLETDGSVLVTTGRISSEMISKAARLRTPLVGSLTALSSKATKLAETWGITTVGYIRQGQLTIYTHPQRILVGRNLPVEVTE
ncbi:MAG: formate dehydrogenase accessory sulfurtransferase FdhD, partial [Chloroflexota bacterium]|nr:formate dehydrogenase accessory sulfurtransferase FdhD [Chloroflexota bacterium]